MGRHTSSKDNKAHAVRAAELLREGKQVWSTGSLWRAVTDDPQKTHSSRIDVVLALWKKDLIVRKGISTPSRLHWANKFSILGRAPAPTDSSIGGSESCASSQRR